MSSSIKLFVGNLFSFWFLCESCVVVVVVDLVVVLKKNSPCRVLAFLFFLFLWSFLSGYCTWVVFFFLRFSCGLI